MLSRTGHSSAASLPTGPVMADPFISPFGFTICEGRQVSPDALFNSQPASMLFIMKPFCNSPLGPPHCDRERCVSHGPASQKSAVSTYYTSVVLEVQVNTIRSPPRLALSHNHSRHDLFPQLRLSLLDCSHNHVTHASGWQTVKTSADTLNGDDVEISCAGVVAAVHDRTAVQRM